MESKTLINLDYLRKLSRGDEKFVEDVIELFLKNTPSAIRNMKKYYQNENWDDLMMEAHKIRPSFNFMGIKELEDAAKAIENNASKQSNTAQIKELLEKIEKISEYAFVQLKEELKKIGQKI